ncbi:hypothetical protein APX86_05480 [Escherichia coli]|nr:hypothetical protein APX86_05480 [Escherichia coli]
MTPQNPYNKQVFVEANLHFSTVINLWLNYRLSANLIENNLSLFDAHFQDLYIDKYQFLQIMLIMFQ